MQSHSIETWAVTTELKVGDSSTFPLPLVAEIPMQYHGSVIKGRLAKQRRYEIEALFDRLKEAERRLALLEGTLREIQPHFFDDHPISKKIVIALSNKK